MSRLNSSRFGSIYSSGVSTASSFRPTFISPRRTHLLPRGSTCTKSAVSNIYQTSRLSLEECVLEIESILDDPGISTLLSPSQAAAIDSLRDKVNQCQPLINPVGNGDNVSSSMIPAPVLENLEDPNNIFLASTYGGLRVSNSTVDLTSLWSEHSACLSADGASYVPPEWKSLSESNKTKLSEILSLKNLERWDFNILDVLDCVDACSVLVLVGWAIIGSPASQEVMMASLGKSIEKDEESSGYNFSSTLGVDHKSLVSFFRSLEAQYSTMQKYHNNIHAADVLQTLHSMIRMGVGDLSDSLSTIHLFAMLLAAAAHDVGHPGTNNFYQINAQTNLAIVYNDKSPLENMHASKASQLLKSAHLLEHFSHEQATLVRTKMIQAILTTDMSHHFNSVSYIEDVISRFDNDGVDWYDFVHTDQSTDVVNDIFNFMIHLADISNPAKPRSLAKYWAECALAEFFAQGDLEKELNLPISPLCDRDKTNLATSQRDFIRYVVLPAYEVLGKIIPAVGSEVLPRIKDNLQYWESQC